MAFSSDVGEPRVDEGVLRRFITGIFVRVGVSAEDAEIVSHVLVEADVTGRGTHGVSRLPLYVERITRGLINPSPHLKWTSHFPGLQHLNGGNGLGPVVAWRAVERVVSLAQEQGTGLVSVSHSNHCGAMSVYCAEAARQGVVLMALSNSPPGIPPWGGRKPYFGTNPIAFGFPRGNDRAPLVIDLATSVVARGNIIEAARRGQPIPEGWAIDKDGNATQDAQEALAGAVLPMAGVKGYALALAVEILSGVLSGAGFGPGVLNPYTDYQGPSNVGHFFWAFVPGGILSDDAYHQRLETLEEEVRSVPPVPGQQVRLPGDRGQQARQVMRERGIPLDHGLWSQLNDLAERLDSSRLE